METASKTAERGSAKLFSLASHDHEGIAKALGMARGGYEIKWWWKYGQPKIDMIKTHIQVAGPALGQTVSQLMQLNSSDVQVTAQCFPYGTPKPDAFRVELEIRTNP